MYGGAIRKSEAHSRRGEGGRIWDYTDHDIGAMSWGSVTRQDELRARSTHSARIRATTMILGQGFTVDGVNYSFIQYSTYGTSFSMIQLCTSRSK